MTAESSSLTLQVSAAGPSHRPLRVACILCARGFGGSQNSCMAISAGLRALGHEVRLFCDLNTIRFASPDPGVRLVDLPGCPILLQVRNNVRAINALRLIAHYRRWPFDAAIVFTPNGLLLTEPLRLLFDVPVVFFLLGIAGRMLPAFDGPVVANCNEVRDWIVGHTDRSADTIPVVRARLASITALERRAGEPCPELAQVPRHGRRVVIVSRLANAMKVGMMTHSIRAADLLAERLDDFCLLIAGDGPARAPLEALAAAVNRRHNRTVVHLIGFVHNVPALLATADVVVGIARGILEGMALGKPAINVAERGFAGIVSPETVAVLEPSNFAGTHITESVPPAPLADALERILTDSGYARELGRFSRQFVLDHYDPRIGAAEFERVIRDELARPPRPWCQRLRHIPALARMTEATLRSTLGNILHKG